MRMDSISRGIKVQNVEGKTKKLVGESKRRDCLFAIELENI
jgi:hypothetical protein